MNNDIMNNDIINKINILIKYFKKYDLEKKISKMAIDTIKHELVTSQIKEAAIQELKAKIQEESKQEEDIPEKIKQVAIDTIKHELVTSQIKEAAIQDLNKQIQEESKQEEEEDIPEKIKQVAIDAVKHELVVDQIKEAAIQELNKQILQDEKNHAKEIIKFFILIHLPLIKTIIAIKKAAIEAVKKNTDIESIEEQLSKLVDEFENANKIMNNANNNEERKAIEKKLNETLKQLNQLLESHNNMAKNIIDYENQIAALLKEIDILNRINNANIKSQMPYLDGLENTVAELKQTNLQNELKNVAINKVLSSLPKVAEPKIDVKPLIENVAINKVKDALNDAVINDLKTKIAESETKLKSTIEANVKRNLEEIAIKTVERETTGRTKTAPGTSTGPNIENELKNAAITALYRALLGVPRETIKPIDITKPQDKFDIRITDKTYDYKDGKQTEIPELRKYDSILAKK
jgi:hypothetical protein